MSKYHLAGTAALAVIAFAASPTQAAVVRAWVSGHGSDAAGCGAPTNACRTLQYTRDNIIAAGGEIDILDPAGYGTLTITKSISVVNDGVGTAGVQSNSGNGITINAGPTDAIYLRGLNIDGLQKTGANGIEFEAGGSLTVVNCVVRHFLDDGLLIDAASGTVTLRVFDSLFLENLRGINYSAPSSSTTVANGVLDHVRSEANSVGGLLLSSSGISGKAWFTVANSDLSENGTYGITVDGGIPSTVSLEINTSTVDHNTGDGLDVRREAFAHITRSVFDFNGQNGIDNQTSSPGGLFSSGDNHTENNTTATSGAAPTSETLH
jgi:Right handed beta helix region